MQRSQKGNAVLILLLILLIAFAVWLGFFVHNQYKTTPVAPALKPATASSGNDNQSLNSNLQSINNGLNQSDQNMQNSDNALGDQQLPITE